MNRYETLFVLKPTLTDEETTAQITKITDVLHKQNAELLATDLMGMRKLAYTVEKQNRGYYTVLYYKTHGSTIAEIERNLRINEEVIKFLTIKFDNTKEIKQFNKIVDSITQKSKHIPAPIETKPIQESESIETKPIQESESNENIEATEETKIVQEINTEAQTVESPIEA